MFWNLESIFTYISYRCIVLKTVRFSSFITFCYLQVFTPKESMSSPLVLHLIFCQIVSDMFNKYHSVHARISADEREEMLDVSINNKIPYPCLENLNSNFNN